MGKVWNYVVIGTGMILLLEMVGIETAAHGLLAAFGLSTSSVDVGASSFFDYMFNDTGGLLALLLTTSGVAVAYFLKADAENILVIPMIMGPLALVISTMVGIVQYTIAGTFPLWITSILILILGPFAVGYALALVDYFRGND